MEMRVLNSGKQVFLPCSSPLASHSQEVQANYTGEKDKGNAMW